MGKIFHQCPACKSQNLNIVKIECQECHTKFEGVFSIPPLLSLNDEDIQFIINFIKCSGSLKEMAVIQKISYPTLRNRLNQLIEQINQLDNSLEQQKDSVLKKLESGQITAKEAAALLSNL